MKKYKSKFCKDRKGVYIVVPKEMVKKYGWKKGDTINVVIG